MAGKNIVRTQALAAKAIGVTLQTLNIWMSKQGCPGKVKGGYDVDVIRGWRALNKGYKGLGKGNGIPVKEEEVPDGLAYSGSSAHYRLKVEQAREKAAKAKMAEIDLKIAQGKYIPREQMAEKVLALIAVFKRSLFGMENRMAATLVGLDEKEIKQVWRTLVRELLERLAKMHGG